MMTCKQLNQGMTSKQHNKGTVFLTQLTFSCFHKEFEILLIGFIMYVGSSAIWRGQCGKMHLHVEFCQKKNYLGKL